MVQIIQGVANKALMQGFDFISHMVQIIQAKKTTKAIPLTLYIPHGSDNTKLKHNKVNAEYLKTLYPTWFR